MDVLQTISARYSVRAYRSDPVEEEKLAQLLEAFRLAPTAANRQPFRLLVVHSAGRQAELARIYSDGRPTWFSVAPLVLAIVAVPAESWRRRDGKPYYEVDAAIAMDHLVLAAAELGLGTCWIAAFDPSAAREVLGLPDEVEPIVFTPLGYAADEPRRRGAGRLRSSSGTSAGEGGGGWRRKMGWRRRPPAMRGPLLAVTCLVRCVAGARTAVDQRSCGTGPREWCPQATASTGQQPRQDVMEVL